MGRLQARIKEPVNALTHFVTLVAAVSGMAVLLVLVRRSSAAVIVGLVYGASMVALYSASTAYHWWKTTSKREVILRRLDHGAINILIAGSATPVFYFGLQGTWRATMLAVVWSLAVLCGAIQIIFIKAPRWIHTVLYLALGWVAVVPLPQLIRNLPTVALVLLGAGGLSYTVGAVVYATKKPNFFPGKLGFHEIFHLFVSAGTAAHFAAIVILMLARLA